MYEIEPQEKYIKKRRKLNRSIKFVVDNKFTSLVRFKKARERESVCQRQRFFFLLSKIHNVTNMDTSVLKKQVRKQNKTEKKTVQHPILLNLLVISFINMVKKKNK